jgi:hypothetical protein
MMINQSVNPKIAAATPLVPPRPVEWPTVPGTWFDLTVVTVGACPLFTLALHFF